MKRRITISPGQSIEVAGQRYQLGKRRGKGRRYVLTIEPKNGTLPNPSCKPNDSRQSST